MPDEQYRGSMSGENAKANANGKANDCGPSELPNLCLVCNYDMGPFNPRQLCGKSCCLRLGSFGPLGPFDHQFSDESDEAETRDTNIEVGKVGVPDIKKIRNNRNRKSGKSVIQNLQMFQKEKNYKYFYNN